MRIATTILTVLMLSGCGRTTEPVEPAGAPQQVQAGDTVTLRYGGSARLENGATLVFRAVDSDSRCPINAVCVWMGDAVIRLDAARRGEAWETLTLHSHIEPRRATFDGFTIELLQVAPSRIDPDDLKPSDYSVTLAISRG